MIKISKCLWCRELIKDKNRHITKRQQKYCSNECSQRYCKTMKHIHNNFPFNQAKVAEELKKLEAEGFRYILPPREV